MATSLSAAVPFAADPARTFELVTEPAYVEAVAARTGGSDIEVSVTPTDDGGAVVVSARSLPADVPSFAKAMVGDTIRLVETRTYGPAAADGSREGTVEATFGSAPMRLSGTLRLAPEASGSAITLDASVKASVPLIGGKIERFAADEVQTFIAKEAQVAADRLA